MFKTIQLRRALQAQMEERDAKAPKAGDPAPDFELCDVDGQNPVRLSELYGQKPVALIFGSFT